MKREFPVDRRSLIGLMALGLGITVLPGCGGGGGTGSGEVSGQVLRVAQTTEPTTLDPAKVEDGPTIELLMQVFDGLVQWNTESELVPALAERWEVQDGGRTYVFHLREGVKFHNGRELTAEDFVYSITRSLNPKVGSAVAMVYLNDIVGAQEYRDGKADTVAGLSAPDSRTLKIQIVVAKAYFLAKLTYPTAYAVCREEVEKTGGKIEDASMIGTGPFKLVEYRRGDRIILDANPDYFEGAPKLARMERRILLDNGSRRDKFEAGELDIADISMATYHADKENPELQPLLRQFPRPSVFYLALNQKAYAPFKNKKVRQAFAMAVNRQQIVDTVHEGVPQVAHGIVPTGVPGHDPNFRGLPFDPERARKLLAEAGYPGGRGLPPLTLSFRASVEDIKNTAIAVQDDLKRNLGVTVELDEVEWGTFLSRRSSGSMPFYFLRWAADYLDPQNFLSLMLHSRAPENSLGYSNPEFDRLCEAADVMQDPEKRLATYRKAEALAVDDAPWIPIYFQKDVELWNPRLRGVEDSLMGHLPHKRTYFEGAE
jgi:oligopeptide transport system substrate-binding protein